MRKLLAAAVLVIASVGLAVPAQAIPLLGNLGSTVNGGFVGTPDSADDFATGNVGLNIGSIDLRWNTGNGAIGNRVGIFTAAGGLPSGIQVGTWFTSGLATASNTVINYVGAAALAANTTYWMVVDIIDQSLASYTFNQVVFSDPSTQGATIIGPNPGSAFGNIQAVTWSNDPANLMYQLNSAAVPEPGIVLMFGTGLLAMGFARRKRSS